MSVKHLVSVLLVIVMTTSVLVPVVSAAESNETGNETPDIAISLDAYSIDFGDLGPGDESDPISIAVTNVGIDAANVTIEVAYEGGDSLLSEALSIDDEDWRDCYFYLNSYDRRALSVSVSMPSDATSTEDLDGSVVIWVEAVAPLEGMTWSSFQGNPQRTGYYSGDAPDTNDVLWISEEIGAVSSSSVVIGEGKVFVYCFDLGTVSGKKQSSICAWT